MRAGRCFARTSIPDSESMAQMLYVLLLFGAVVVTGAMAWGFHSRQAQWAEDVRRLADIKYALDQAAIVATTDVTGRITHVNDKFCEISGYSREELVGRDHRIVNSGLHSKEFIRDMWRTIANGRVWHGELRNRARDGHYYWVDTTIVPFVNEHGKPYQYIAIRNDITARKAAEDRLREQAALARVGQMAAVVAHEVKNPLAGIKGVVQVLMSRRRPDDSELPVMRDIVERIDALSELIHDLLLFARPRPLRLEPLDLRELLAQSIEVVRIDPAAAAVAITLDSPVIPLKGDAELLKSAVLNLLLNSAQAMHGHGAIHVDASVAAGRCRLQIADNGPGIPDEIREKVFEPFFTTKSRGGGLGLPIARRTIELHGGTVDLDTRPGGGTIARIQMPLDPPLTNTEPAQA